jgi:hypothetical protein
MGGGMGKCLVTFAVLLVGCGGLASTESEAPSPPSSDDSLCAVTDGSIDAVWGGTTLTLAGSCGAPKLAFIDGSRDFEVCVQDEGGHHLVLGENAPGQGEWAQVFIDDQGMTIPWVANSIPGFTLTVTAVRPPGQYIEGTFAGLVQKQDTRTGAQAGPTTSLSGSFKVCRAPDEPAPK